ncbi:MAG: family 78 glycoside hydrolase catalytic domain [Bacteroidales bacterium]|nr:family 78 glycoside hydrolase catalytic domain [Bacteroidales bacterium]
MNKTDLTRTLIVLLGLAFAGILTSCDRQKGSAEIAQMQCEYLEQPKGIDMEHPRFSWVINHTERGVSQSAYRLLVADNREDLENDAGNFWDSGKIQSGQSVNIEYKGKPLQSSKTYFWKVQVWYGSGDSSGWSNINTFQTGIIHESGWEAEWTEAVDTSISSPLMRKNFILNGKVEEALAHVTGLGYYEFYLNGKKVGDHVLDPALTNYEQRVLYSTYDVTDQLNSGSNAAGIMLGNGALRMKKIENRYSWGGISNDFGAPKALVQIEITLADGTQKTIATDGTWKSSSGPVTFNHFYAGEDYDARKEKPGWSTPDYDASEWQGVRTVSGPGGKLDAQLMPPIKVTETITPVKKTTPEPDVYLYDMGQNFPGWWRLKVKGKAGAKVRIRGAETLNDSLFPKPLKPEDQISTKHNYHANVWSTYTLKGEGTETYEPRFFYTGFRYVEVSVDDPDKFESVDIEGRVVHSNLSYNGSFAASNTLLNDIHKASIWSQRGNSHGYPTDCPQREKGAYTGDGQVIAEASMHDFHMAAFYNKWLNDMRDAQQDNGRIPNTAPELVGGHGGGIAWGSAYILLPWWMYHYYDDTRILEQHYPYMKQYIRYLYNLARSDANPEEKLIINDFGGYWDSLGEWCAPGQSDGPNHPVVNTAYYFKDVQLFSQIAKVLGKKEDVQRYSELSDSIAEAYNQKFFNPNTHLYGTDSTYQTYQMLALSFDLVPENHRDEVLQTVIDDIRENRNGHLNTGIIGTKYLWPVLVKSGHGDLAYNVATQTTYPSYGYWLENGATTLWEKWSGEASHNHQMFGSVDEFFFKYLAGLRAPTDKGTSRGYKHIQIKPFVPDDLSSVEASLETVSGKVEAGWENRDNSFRLQVTLPANTTGEICIPLLKGEAIEISEGAETIWKAGTPSGEIPGIKDAKKEEDYISFSVESGTYQFTMKETQNH